VQNLGMDGGHDGGVNAARDPNDGPLNFAQLHEASRPVEQRGMHVGDGVVSGIGRGGKGGSALERDLEGEGRGFEGVPAAEMIALCIVGAGGAVKGEDGLAVVLDTDLVDVEQGPFEAAGMGGKDAVSLMVLVEREGGRAGVDEEIDFGAGGQDRERGNGVVQVPRIFAKDAPKDGVAGVKGRQKVLDAAILFERQFTQIKEVAAVIELAVVGHQGLNAEGVRAVCGSDKGPAVRHKDGVILAHTAVFVAAGPVDGHITEDGCDVLRSLANRVSAGFALMEKRLVLPFIAKEVSGNGHFGEDDELNSVTDGFTNVAKDRVRIFARSSREDVDLGESAL